MTKKHFKLLAQELAYAKPVGDLRGETADEYRGWEAAVRAVAHACYAANPRFNYATFYKAAGLAEVAS